MEIAGIEDLIEYVEELSAKCGWPEDDRRSILADLRQIRDRVADPRLYLGVVGEFSAGKSTFINALLGVELLKTDILQGTTCTPTFLAAGRKFEVEVVFKDGTSLKYSSTIKPVLRVLRSVAGFFGFWRPWLKDAREFISRYTAEEEFSCDVERVELTLPVKMPFFAESVVLVDTPGVNAENGRHQDVTESAMRRYCDLVAVLTVATEPCPQSLMAFLHQNEASVKGRCIGLITQIDRIRRAERARQISFVQARFQSEDIDLLGLYAVAPYYTVHPKDADNDDRIASKDQFKDVIAKIMRQLAENKIELMTNKTRELLERVVGDHVIPVMNRSRAATEELIGRIQSVRMVSCEVFCSKWLNVCHERLAESRVSEDMVSRFACSLVDSFIDEIREKVVAATSRLGVVRAYAQGITRESIRKQVVSAASKEFDKWSSNELQMLFRCRPDFLEAISQSYGIVVDEKVFKTKSMKKRPTLVCKCDISACAWKFVVKYWLRIIAVIAGEVLVGILSLATMVISFGVSLIVGLLIAIVLFKVMGNVEFWKSKAAASLSLARGRLFATLHGSLQSSVQNVFDFDLGVIDEVIERCNKYKSVIDKKIQEQSRNISQEQDKVLLAKDALPVLNNALSDIKIILASTRN